MEAVVNIISSVGFPIFCTIVLFWQNKNIVDTHKEETAHLAESINKNTEVLTRLVEKLSGDNTHD